MSDLDIYKNDRPKWLEIVAPKQAERMADDTYDDNILYAIWGAMTNDYRRAVWALLPVAAKERIKRVRAMQ